MLPIIHQYLSLEVKGSRYGLPRTRALLDACGSPDEHLSIVHVAGTNGKGSICAYLTSILLRSGKRVGTFTSPAVYDFAEQFAVNGEPLPEQTLGGYLQTVWEIAERMEDKPTAFERMTAAALLAFDREGCEYAVVECGLGGLTDATNAIRHKEAAVISSVSLEHTALLGSTVSLICEQKAGIIRNCPAIVNAWQNEEATAYFARRPDCQTAPVPQSCKGNTFVFEDKTYTLPLYGREQAYNALTALAVARRLKIDEDGIFYGLSTARLLGRIEVLRKGEITYVLDGSHNPAAFAPLVEWASDHEGDKDVVYSCLADKDAVSVAKRLAQMTDRVFIVPSPSYRARSLDGMKEALSSVIPHITAFPSVADALSRTTRRIVIVCGTFTILKEAKEWIEK